MSTEPFPPPNTMYRRKHTISVIESHPREASYGSLILGFLNQSGQGTTIQLDVKDLLRTYHTIGVALMSLNTNQEDQI